MSDGEVAVLDPADLMRPVADEFVGACIDRLVSQLRQIALLLLGRTEKHQSPRPDGMMRIDE